MSKIPTYQPILTLSVNSITDIPVGRFVEATGRLCRAGAKSLGVSEIESVAGEIVPVITIGTCLVLANDNISVGMDLSSNATGMAIPYDSGYFMNGVALTSAIAGEYVKVLLRP